MTQTKTVALAGAGVMAMMLQAASALAQDGYQIPQITVYTQQDGTSDADGSGTTKAGSTTLNSSQIEKKRASTNDTAALLQDVLGVNLYTAGGVSSLPTMHGLADDRLRIKVDGMDIVASCPNHMNPALSYIDPTSVGSIKVWTGVAPVSVSGDSIGGAISVQSAKPKFAGEASTKDGKADGGTLITGNVGAFYRTNGNAHGANLNTTLATDSLSLTYNASYAQSDDYEAGGDFKKFSLVYVPPITANVLSDKTVGSSAYEAFNQSVDLAWQDSDSLIDLKLGMQKLPYEWYPNQRMDMLDNTSFFGNLRLEEKYSWGKLEASAYHQYVDHFMDFGEDRNKWYGWLSTPTGRMNVMGMPMYTESYTTGLSTKAEINVSPSDTLRLGAEAQFYRLDDWWPPSPDCGYTGTTPNCTGGMAPNTFWNISNGKRDRLAAFGEWESQWNDQWQSLLGARLERVATDTGDVHGYSTFYNTSSAGSLTAFNNLDRSKVDYNLDLSSIVTFKPDNNLKFDFGLAQKNRSPNLYERYDWSRSPMALEMNNFVGDGNGYMGDVNLKKETSRTISFTGDWHSNDNEMGLVIAPYYTHVANYIDAVQWNMTTNMPANPNVTGPGSIPFTGPNQFVMLKYVNHAANIGGIDVAVRMPLAKSSLGEFGLTGNLNYARGVNTVTHDGLYNIMPLNGKVALTHKLDGWESGLEFVMVDGKDHVSSMRNEMHTPGYSLLNLRSSYTMNKWKFNFGIENILDTKYYLPLGGAYVGEGNSMSFMGEVGNVRLMNPTGVSTGSRGTATIYGTGVPGPGRSFYLTTSYSF